MEWAIPFALISFIVLRVKRARGGGRTAELAPTGIFRSPLYWTSIVLVLLLLALVFYIGRIHHHQMPIPSFFWFAVLAIVVALLLLRRALKWRYPL